MSVVDHIVRELPNGLVACIVTRGQTTAKVWMMITNAVLDLALTESASAAENEGACNELTDAERAGGTAVHVESALDGVLVDDNLGSVSHGTRLVVTEMLGGLHVSRGRLRCD